MATCRPLYVGPQPRVVSFPRWMHAEKAVLRAVRRLERAPGVHVLMDRSAVVLVIPMATLDEDEPLAALLSLVDEITVWRLSTADGARPLAHGSGFSAASAIRRTYYRARGAA